MLASLLGLLVAFAPDPEITAFKTTPLTLYDAGGRAIEKLAKADLPPLPLPIADTNDFGYLEVAVKGRVVYIRPADVKHDLNYCGQNVVTQQSSGTHVAGAKPPGVRRGASEGGVLCIPR